jgi:hypothetical protein
VRTVLSTIPTLLALAGVLTPSAAVASENMDPAGTGAQHAWSENSGWWNGEPSGDGGPGVQVGDALLTGWIWSENLGWISLSCQNTASCASNPYGVVNDGAGRLSGFAWSENAGWINFAPQDEQGTVFPVLIDPGTGTFSGHAWAENLGWISFQFSDAASIPYQMRTSWRAPTPLLTPTVTPTGGGGQSHTPTPTRTRGPGLSPTATGSPIPPLVPTTDPNTRVALLVALVLLGAATSLRKTHQERRP